MTVYVDDMHAIELGRFRRMKMSHMIADTTEELIAMARTIGVNTRWLQHPGEPGEHFDIAKGKRELAIAAGAVPITLRQCSAMCFRRRVTGELGRPEDAEAWRDAHVAARRAA
ncbi:DUF4031 domain-containing protein [Burkholderia multivorans]|uniref:DUF4031 domain-containing protein n=1 Tax=Burkholderia multivorans TaxID=87883 RepID=UPI001C22823E|nr:DUF4031 domain-containing protein [Burkholderia multivorans]ULR75112.1 hypothetical protein JC1_40 [Burkholderia phage JC1]MBU9386626.1 DUF4031 domain-containing protein [Burkholderia multivorans]MBU9437060.1 DUF4031 domain-containing protein [Burkholderia multivorans]MBU9606265.1 DUF4031 domain-containing protein [Burkholderia multivorans]MBU9624824.1 DUF4031 domain-containing protein [Burkholderia multivorans]